MIRGITVTLYERTQTGVDAFHAPVYEETPVTVSNVLIGEPTTDEIATSTDLYGKKLLCWLAIPKGDTHDWTDKHVEWTDAQGNTRRVQTFGYPLMGVEANVPGPWHVKVRCAAYGEREEGTAP